MQTRAPSFEQLQVFLAVAETGSLAAAGRRLGRATSAVSYAIDNLEAQLGLILFARGGTRRPTLTEAGGAMLSEARAVLSRLGAMHATAQGLKEGLEAELSMVVDVMLPTCRLVDALRAFQETFPTVGLRLRVEALGAVAQAVLDGTAAIGVNGPLPIEGELSRTEIAGVRMLPVAAPSHPLAGGPQPQGAARDHVQLVLTDRSKLTEGRDFAVLALRTWRLCDLGAKHALLLAGLGWGAMPEPMVRADLDAGRLAALRLPEWRGELYSLQLIHSSCSPPGPAARWMLEKLASQPGEDAPAPASSRSQTRITEAGSMPVRQSSPRGQRSAEMM